MPTIHFQPGDNRREWPAQGVAAPRTEARKRELDLLYKNVPALPTAPQPRQTISDVDMRFQQTREYANTPRLRYEPHRDGRPGGRVTPIVAPAFSERTAYHEAGHAVLQLHSGCDSVDAIVRNDGSGLTTPKGAAKSQYSRQEMVLSIAQIAAGRISEVIKFGSAEPFNHTWRLGTRPESDSDKLQFLPRLMPDENSDKLRAEGTALAEKVLRERWADVELIAGKLAKSGKVSVKETTTQIRRVQLPLQTRSATVTTSGDDIKICWGTGEMVKRSGFNGTYLEDLPPANADLTWMNTGKCPLLDSHNNSRVDDVLGVIAANSAYVKDGKGFASIRLGSNASVNNNIASGTLRNLSIGYSVGAMKRNGSAADDTPIMTVTSYRILECSIVGVPADKGAEILRKYPAEISG